MERRLELPLFLLRISIFLVMFMWTLDKIVRPDHAIAVFENFYLLSFITPKVMLGIGIAEMLILAGFLLGVYKTLTYGLVLLFHLVSTVSSYAMYLSPFEGANLLFFAAWPMLAACIVLYMLRDFDRLMALGKTSRERRIF